MEEYKAPKKPEAKWEPGTLDQTRRNIGPIDQNEAQKMMKKLGGEIFTEKSAPIDYSTFPKAEEYSRRVVGKSASSVASEIQSGKNDAEKDSSKGSKYGYAVKEKKQRNIYILPEIPGKEKSLMDRLMMSEDFKIKANYGLFNFMRHFKKNGMELVRRSFVEYDIQKHVEHLQAFIASVKSLIQIAPETYKSKIITSQEDKFRILKTVGSWKMHEIKAIALSLQDTADTTTVAMMIPFVKAVYRDLLSRRNKNLQHLQGNLQRPHKISEIRPAKSPDVLQRRDNRMVLRLQPNHKRTLSAFDENVLEQIRLFSGFFSHAVI